MSTNVFIAFAKEDLDVRDKLLRQMNLVKDREGWDIWASHEIKAGSDWSADIKQRLSGSEVVILLMSSSFFQLPLYLEHGVASHDRQA
ncbi:MAG: toll/interleukin-1 receptor domain-containing protein [Saprospiraceae bacterium]|nr:toll/interleukin-1 receptor domain-containing protein [Saprospiraceae bacterium]